MTFSDGYGDHLSPDELLQMYERRAQVIALEWASPVVPKDDLAQEARIALWREATKYPDKDLTGLVSVIMRRAVGRAATRQQWTGAPSQAGRPLDPLKGRYSALEAELDGDPLLASADLLAEVELAYHHGEIMQAIAAMPLRHREYVYLRFWMGLNDSEVGRLTHRQQDSVSRTWRNVIRPRLKKQLSHLASSV